MSNRSLHALKWIWLLSVETVVDVNSFAHYCIFFGLEPFPHARLTHRPDDGGSKDSETLVKFYQTTRRCNPEDSHLHTHRRENLKSYFIGTDLIWAIVDILLTLKVIGESFIFLCAVYCLESVCTYVCMYSYNMFVVFRKKGYLFRWSSFIKMFLVTRTVLSIFLRLETEPNSKMPYVFIMQIEDDVKSFSQQVIIPLPQNYRTATVCEHLRIKCWGRYFNVMKTM
jgi:hypothetical protein